MDPTSRASGSNHNWTSVWSYDTAAQLRIASIVRAKVRTEQLQPVIDAAVLAADPDEERTRGPHSLAEDGLRRLHEFNRHTPRRSNLAHQRFRITRWRESVRVSFRAFRAPGGRYAGSLKLSPRASIAQAVRAFIAATATAAFQ